jgi:predicted Zn-dependent peptidase
VAPAGPQAPASLSTLVEEVAIPFETITLENGLTAIVHTDRKAPVVGVAMWYNVGSKDEPEGKTGFAHLFEHLMFNGSENAPGDYFEYLQQVGATDYNGTTNFDRTNYFQTVPSGAIERALFLESDRMGYLLGAVTQEKLDNQRGVVQNEKRQGDNNPGGLVFYEILDNLFPEGHPYKHNVIGSMADLDSASMEDVRNWFRDKYGPNNATLVLAGDISAEEARPLLEKYFGDIERGPVNNPAQAAIPTLSENKRVEMQDRVAATEIMMYWPVPGITDAELTALTVGTQVLGGLSSSRLDNIMVRDDQIAVSVSAGNYPFQRVGVIEVSATVKPGVDARQVEARLKQLVDYFIETGPTEDEVSRAATQSVSSTIRGLEQVGGFSGKAVTLANGSVLAGDPAFYATQLDVLGSITTEDVKAAMQKWMTRPSLTIVLSPGERSGDYEEAASVSGGDAAAAETTELVQGEPRTPPPLGETPSLDFPDITETTLSNGLKVNYAQRDAVPVTRVAVSFNAGSAADPVELRGLESLAMGVMDEGTTTRTSQQIAEEKERLGAVISLGGGADRSSFTLTAMSANLAPSLELLTDVVRNPAFDPDEIERIRAQQLTGIEQTLTQPGGIAFTTLEPLIYGAESPYGGAGIGTTESVSAITRDDLVAFQQSWFRPDNAELFVVSDLSLKELEPQLEAAFGNWEPAPVERGEKAFDALASTPTAAKIVVVDRPNSPQSFIAGGLITSASGHDEGIIDLVNANQALGGNFLARINMNLREDKGWSYGARGGPTVREGSVAYLVQAPVQADRTGDSLKELIREIGEFTTTNGVTDEELERIVNNEILQLPGQFETSASVLGGMQQLALFDRPQDYYEQLADRYRAQTTDSLDAAARAAIDINRFTWVVVGDRSVIDEQLADIGLPIEYVELDDAAE